jgi:hypothetical protein
MAPGLAAKREGNRDAPLHYRGARRAAQVPSPAAAAPACGSGLGRGPRPKNPHPAPRAAFSGKRAKGLAAPQSPRPGRRRRLRAPISGRGAGFPSVFVTFLQHDVRKCDLRRDSGVFEFEPRMDPSMFRCVNGSFPLASLTHGVACWGTSARRRTLAKTGRGALNTFDSAHVLVGDIRFEVSTNSHLSITGGQQ